MFVSIIGIIIITMYITTEIKGSKESQTESSKLEEYLKTEYAKLKSKEKMQSHPLPEAIKNALIPMIDAHILFAADRKIGATESDTMYISVKYNCVSIRQGYHKEDIYFSSYGYDHIQSHYDLQAFREYLYSELKTHYTSNTRLTWALFENSDTLSIGFNGCHPKLKSI